MASFEGDNQVVFYYFSTSEIWPDNRDGLRWGGSYRFRTIVYDNGNTNDFKGTIIHGRDCMVVAVTSTYAISECLSPVKL